MDGGNTHIFTDESKQTMIGKLKGRHLSPNTEFKKGQLSGKSHPMFGKHHTEEAKEKLKEKNSGINSPKVKIYDLSLNPLVSPTGEIFTKIEGLRSFCKKHNLKNSTLCRILQNKKKINFGWHLQGMLANVQKMPLN
jgi:hypothetical protein